MKRSTAVVVALMSLAASQIPQATFRGFTINVSDARGPLAGVSFELRENGRAVRSGTTQASGQVRFGYNVTPAGEYALVVEAPGHRSWTIPLQLEPRRGQHPNVQGRPTLSQASCGSLDCDRWF